MSPNSASRMHLGFVLPLLLLALFVLFLCAALVFGGPNRPPTLHSISDPFAGLNHDAMPLLSRFTARDDSVLAFRHYAPADSQPARGSVIFVHGSSANSQSGDLLAQSFAKAGYAVYALDVRGHGASGLHGHIAYIGQLEDDLEDFMRAIQPAAPTTLTGFSSGGGFALRVAGGTRRSLFDNYLFMSPYIHYRAATARSADSAGWASVGTPRLLALMLLNRCGITTFNKLPVIAFAVADTQGTDHTPWYSYALAANFQPHDDYQADIRAIDRPAAVIAGQDDEVFFAAKFRQVLDESGRNDIPVTLVPATGHTTLTINSAARTAVVETVRRLDEVTSSKR